MKILNTIDSAFLTFMEGMCQQVQVRIGCTNFWMAGKFGALVVLLLVVELIIAMRGGHSILDPKDIVGIIAVGSLVPGLLHYALFRWQTAEREAFERLRKGLSNPAKIHPIYKVVRFVCVIWVVLSGIFSSLIMIIKGDIRVQITQFAVVLLISAHLFLRVCDPLPPCPATFQKSLRAWIRARMPLDS